MLTGYLNASMNQRKSVYGHEEWAKHKSSWRHGRHILSIVSSGVIFRTGPPVVLCTLVAVFVSVFNHLVAIGHLPNSVQKLEVSSIPFTLTSSVLSLLLVFRTNSSYNRFDEARKAWGSNVNRTRDLARQALTNIRSPEDTPQLHCLLRHIKAYSFCLKSHLTIEPIPPPPEGAATHQEQSPPSQPRERPDQNVALLREELAGVLEPRELASVMASAHKPNHVVQIMSELMTHCHISGWDKINMDDNITQFHDNIGTCERLFKTPIPVAYTCVTSRFLMLWHLTLPFALWEDCHWLTIPVTFATAAALFYIEEVGVLIEEPFWVLALNSISNGIVAALDGLAAAQKEMASSLLATSSTD